MGNINVKERVCKLFSLNNEEWLTVFIVALFLLYFYYKIFPRLYVKEKEIN